MAPILRKALLVLAQFSKHCDTGLRVQRAVQRQDMALTYTCDQGRRSSSSAQVGGGGRQAHASARLSKSLPISFIFKMLMLVWERPDLETSVSLSDWNRHQCRTCLEAGH